MSMRLLGFAAFSVASLALFASTGACGDGRTEFVNRQNEFEEPSTHDAGDCPFQCSLDGRSIIRSCTGEVTETCRDDQACGAARCQEPCAAAAADQGSNGCEFYLQVPATLTETADSCYAAFVVNTSRQPVEVSLEREDEVLDLSKAMYRTNPGETTLVRHEGPIPPDESVIVFVSDRDPDVPATGVNASPCPGGVVPAVRVRSSLRTSGIAPAFHLNASSPVSVVAMYPFGGANSYIPTATLLLPVVTWAKEHLVIQPWMSAAGVPTTQIVASDDETDVTIVPTAAIQDGIGIKGGPANVPATYRLGKGQYLQLAQSTELSGSVVTSSKPTAIFGGHSCVNIPTVAMACDALWQQIPAFEQWGSEYVAVGYRSRIGDEDEKMPYRIIAARDGTLLDYDPVLPMGAPLEMSAGQVVTFPAGVGEAFAVRSQDAEHPIYVAAYMTGAQAKYFGSPPTGNGDPEFVNVVPAQQWMNAYSFYADPAYDETSLVVIRAKSHGTFKDVWLDCAGNLPDFRPIGTRGEYEYTRVDLSRRGGPGQKFGDKTCQKGLQRMRSEGPFTATLWGWSPYASYAYPGGMANRRLVTSPLVSVQ